MNAETISAPATSLGQALAGKYLTFRLGRESYGIPVLKVREIIRLTSITAMPQMPDYIKGVINLRGKIIPVADLRAKFSLAAGEADECTCIVVVQIELPTGTKPFMGLIVDGVEEVANIAGQDIEPTPDFGTHLDTAYIFGMAKIKGTVITLLNLDKVMGNNLTFSL